MVVIGRYNRDLFLKKYKEIMHPKNCRFSEIDTVLVVNLCYSGLKLDVLGDIQCNVTFNSIYRLVR